MANKKIIVSVTNDISNDQRVHKVCTSLVKMGFDVVVVGRKRKDSTEINRSYSTHRFKLLFNKGALFYAEYNLRLFFYLFFHSFDFLLANDLDSLLANHLAAKVKRKSVVYDSHEYFTEVPELQGRAFAKNTWIKIEKMCLPGASRMYTVNESIAKLYKEKYNREVEVIRNVPPVFSYKIENAKTEKEKLGLPTDKKLLVVQGTGINIDRGVEEVVQAMQFVENAVLLIIGSGDVLDILKEMVKEMNLQNKVKFIAKVPFEELAKYTTLCDVGLTVDKDTNMNYRYSLPNKIFNYVQAGIAVLASDLVEVARVVREYNVGVIIKNHNPEHIADVINELIGDEEKLNVLKKNSMLAAKELTWENEEKKLKEIFSGF